MLAERRADCVSCAKHRVSRFCTTAVRPGIQCISRHLLILPPYLVLLAAAWTRLWSQVDYFTWLPCHFYRFANLMGRMSRVWFWAKTRLWAKIWRLWVVGFSKHFLFSPLDFALSDCLRTTIHSSDRNGTMWRSEHDRSHKKQPEAINTNTTGV